MLTKMKFVSITEEVNDEGKVEYNAECITCRESIQVPRTGGDLIEWLMNEHSCIQNANVSEPQ